MFKQCSFPAAALTWRIFFFFSCVTKRLLSVSLVTALLPPPWERLPTDGCSERLDAGRSQSYLHGNAGFVTLRENIVMMVFLAMWRIF